MNLLLVLTFVCFVQVNCEIYQSRPKIKTSDGDLILEPALDKNIYLRPNGPKSSIFIGNIDALNTNTAKDSTQFHLSTNLNEYLNGQNEILQRLEILENKVETHVSLVNISLWRKVNSLNRKVIVLRNIINNRPKDDCDTHPCQHGGTCLNLVNGYHCLCPFNWEGRDCDVDVNECRNFEGTDLGCQNGATCINKPGTYECSCKPNWYGQHCTRKAKDCSGGDFEMCGYGNCILSGEGIQCICHQGWTINATSVACLTDVNECESYHPRCSVNPRVECINLPGSFRCGQCPSGYEGDGYICNDVDECIAIPNGGCSPMVTCHNTIGSRICAPCPLGYQGDGVTCTYKGSCRINNGGCHSSAKCIEGLSPTGLTVQCICPEGMDGDGIGSIGCYVSTGNYTGGCENNPCGSHGQCHSLNSSYTCICYNGYGGANCATLIDGCATNPCQNGGICRQDTNLEFRCECTALYSGSLCQDRLTSCGGILDAEEGSIAFPLPNVSITYNHNSQCMWLIRTVTDKVLKVTFSQFNVDSTPECTGDFLQINDGTKSSSQLIGRYCGDTLPKGGTIVSTHNHLYLWFHSDEIVAKTGFVLHWTSVKPVCGGEIDASSHGHISSPGSPGPYPPNRDCYWHFTTTLGKRINLHFFALDIGKHANCSSDYLAIYDGGLPTDPLLSRYCNSTQPPSVHSASSKLLVHFHSDAYGSGNGFQVAYESVEGIPGCGGYFSTDKGEILSPAYNGQYLNNLRCDYKIKTSPETKIKIEFKLFKLESFYRCGSDYLEIYDGPSADSLLVGKFCGTDHPASYTSSSNTLYLQFKSDISVSSKGFRITYEAVCEKTLFGDSGIVKSPLYPFRYPSNIICIYFIKTEPGKAIQLTFQDFDICDYSSYMCRYNNVEVRDGPDINSTLLGRYCGGKAQIPPVQTSTHNYMYIRFKSDHFTSKTGFYANYTTIDTECGGIYRKPTGIINYPRGDNGTPNKNNQTCLWLILAPEASHIKVTWNRFEIANTHDCSRDYLELIEIDDNNKNDLLGRYCGFRAPPAFATVSNRLQLTFVSNVSNAGFSLAYTFLNETTHCGGNYIKPHGTLYSPGWPLSYKPNSKCTWIITVPVGQQILLNIAYFDLPMLVRNQCQYGDYLEIRNGGSQISPLIGQYCGKLQSKTITSLANVLLIHFYSNGISTAKGFIIKWDSTITGCGGTLTSSSGSIHSPNYPNGYHENAECFYKIVTSAGSRIGISFTELELQRTHRCHKDYIEIYDGRDTNALSLGKHCVLSSELKNIETTTNFAFIKFRSDSYIEAKGFVLNYYTICNNTITGRYGVIESPNFPNDYPSNLKCQWNIRVDKGNKINVTFTHFDITRSSWELRWIFYPTTNACDYDYLRIIDISKRNSSQKFCGSSLPNSISTKSNAMEIQFVSVSYIAYTGFRLEWASFGCGGHIRKQSGTVSFDKGLTAENAIECEWLIETSRGKSLNIIFTEIYMSSSENCTTDAIEIYNGKNTQDPLLSKICHEKNASLNSDSNFMIVRFIKLSAMKDVHFIAHFTSSELKCGGSIFAMTGLFYSKNYPKNYDNNQDCFWYISVPVNHRIEINFIDLDLYSIPDFGFNEPTNNICGDSILIYDTNDYSPLSNYTYIICDNFNKTRIVTKYNNVVVQFKTDNYGTAKGFKANFTISCGALILATQDGIITNSKYTTYTNKSCIWTIIAPTPDQKISVTITHMSLTKDADVITNRNCPSTFLRILDGNEKNGPLIEEFCGHKVPPMMVSQGNAITIELGSYTDKIYGNFSIHYSPIINACGGMLNAEEGTIASPLYPKPYPINANCEWVLSTSPGNTAYITFERFDLEYSDACNEDYLEIRENDGKGKLLGLYCGTNIPANQTKAANIYIKFHSNSRTSGQGFLLHFGYSHENYIQALNGEITSPLYPNRYEGAGEYSWRVLISNTDKIALTIYEFDIPSHGDVSYNKLIIYDGYDNTAPILEQLHGALGDRKIIQTSSSAVFIILTMDASNSGSMFHLTWAVSSRNRLNGITCGSNQTEFISPGQEVILKSPNYPKEYGNNLNCEWIYRTQMGRHLSITFISLDLVETRDCYTDLISIYSADSLENWKPIKEAICKSTAVSETIYSSMYMKIKFKTGFTYRSPSRSGFQAAIKCKCGGLVTDLSGEVGPTWSDIITTFHIDQQIKCNWTIKVRPGRMIKLKFAHFNISNENTDCKIFVILHNGESVESPLLASGKYCGDMHERKADIVTSGNSLFVSYTSIRLRLPTFQSFKIYYEEVNDECGSSTKLTFDHRWETINSPNYPSVPIPYSECVWIFTGPPDAILRVDFIDRFDIDKDTDDCGTEVVEIKDGSTDLAPVIGRYCGEKPPTIKSSSNSIYLKYSTQILEPRNGFKANISIDMCGGTIIANSGELKSPGYPRMLVLSHGTVCEWHIIGTPNYVYIIKPLDIHIPLSTTRCATKIEIEEMIPLNNNFTMLKTICNKDEKVLTAIETSSNHFIIKLTFGEQFQWDVYEYRGFRISFNSSQIVCNDIMTTSEGYLISPNYPQETTVTDCHWVIEIPNKSRRIRLELIDSNQEKHEIGIFNDQFVNEIKTISNINFTSLNRIYESVGNTMGIYVKLNPLARSHRFKAKFTSNEQALCGGDLNSIKQEIVSPDLQRSYSCKWHYNNQVATTDEETLVYNSILITLKVNSSVSRNPCRVFDPLIIIKSPVTNRGQKFSRTICGNSEITFRIPSSILDISASKSENDFMNFSLMLKSQPCGGIVHVGESPVNIIFTPDSYNDTLDCAWILIVPNENRVEIEIKGSFLLDCDEEYIKIMPNYDHSVPLGNYCKGNLMESPLLTHYAHMYIEYHSNVKSNTSIKLIVKSTSNQCGGLITSYQNVFTSPNYPESYTANEECAWEILADIGFRVSLQFIDRFVVEDRPNCTKDVVIIYDWIDDAYEEVARVCGRYPPPSYNSTNNRLKVVLRTDAETNLDGFKAQWTPICGANLTATEKEQILYSPGYPSHYGPNMHCSYKITVPNNQKILLKFLEFELEGFSPECISDNLTIAALNHYIHFYNVFCGTEILTIVQNYERIYLEFKTDGSVERKGFKIAYSTYHCGGRVNDTTIITPYIPRGTYEYGLNCTWLIEAPPTKIVVAKLLYIDLVSNGKCGNEYLALYDGLNIDVGKRLALLCGSINSTTSLKSTANRMVFQLISRYRLDDKAFKAVIYFSYSEAVGCGGRIDLTNISSHVLKSPLIGDVVYENFLDCDWSITSPPNTIIKITFNKFHIAPCQYVNQTASGHSKCECDFVEIKDGFALDSLEIGTYCGDSLPPQLTTSGNIMNVRLSTDGEVVSSGFEAMLTVQQSLCGESFIPVGFTPHRLKSPDFDKGSVPRGLHCTYRLDNNVSPYLRIRITVINLHLRPSGTIDDNRCFKDKLIISSTPYRFNSSVGKDLIVNNEIDDYFTRLFNYDKMTRLSKRFVLCGHKEGDDFYVLGSTAITLITSPDSDNEVHRGVEIEVAFLGFCGRNYTEPQGRLVSGDASSTGDVEVDCYTLITAPDNYTITLYFISLTPHYWTSSTFLKIFDGNDTSGQELITINRRSVDNYPVFSTGRYVLLHNHKSSNFFLTYDLNYVTTNKGIGCGGKLHNLVGAVTSPLFPNTYRRNSICEWVLETPKDTRLLIRFKVFDLGAAFGQNYVQLVDRKGAVVRTFSFESPADYTSDDNYLKLVFHTTINNSGRGWSAFFAAVQD